MLKRPPAEAWRRFFADFEAVALLDFDDFLSLPAKTSSATMGLSSVTTMEVGLNLPALLDVPSISTVAPTAA